MAIGEKPKDTKFCHQLLVVEDADAKTGPRDGTMSVFPLGWLKTTEYLEPQQIYALKQASLERGKTMPSLLRRAVDDRLTERDSRLTSCQREVEADGKLIASVMASLAEFERDLRRERIRSGMAAAKARGKRFGQRVKPERLAPKVLDSWRRGCRTDRIGREFNLVILDV